MTELDNDGLKYLSEFQRITGVYPFDCINSEHAFIFLVDNKAELFKSIGKKMVVLNKLVQLFRKPVFIFVGSSDMEKQIRNIFYGLSKMELKVQDSPVGKRATLIVKESERGYAVGKGGIKIKAVKELMKRKFNIVNFRIRTTRNFNDDNFLNPS